MICALLGSTHLASGKEPTQQTAAAEEELEPYDLSLEELLEVEVSVVSKKEETTLDAPGMVTVYSAAQIERYGYYTLADLADITPGYSSYTLFGERTFETRGQKAGSFNNNKHLLLIDGIPVNHAKGDTAQIDYELPLLFADRVEFLRGPSSTLYGTSAFFGVVSIQPKRLMEPGASFEGKVSVGLPVVDPDDKDYQLERRVMANALQRSDIHELALNVGYYGQRPSRQIAGDTGADRPSGYAAPDLTRNWDDQESVFLRVADTIIDGPLKGLTFAAMYWDRTTGHGDYFLGNLYTHEFVNLRWTQLIPYVQFRRNLATNVTLRSFVKYNLSREAGRLIRWDADGFSAEPSGAIPTDSAYDQYAHNLEGLSEVSYRPLDFLNVLLGVDIVTRKQSAGTQEGFSYIVIAEDGAPPPIDLELGSARLTTFSTFGEIAARFDVLEGLNLAGGLRADFGFSGNDEFSQLSPRGTAVLKFTERTALKLLYSSALREPSIKELSLNEEARASLVRRGLDTSGIQPLDAESIQGFEVALAYQSPRISGQTAGFINRTNKPLDGVPFRGENIFANTNKRIDAAGIEGEVQARPWFEVPIVVNASLARAVDENGVSVSDVPILKANLGVGYQLQAPLDVSAHLWTRWVSGYRVSDPMRDGGDGHITLDGNIVAHLTRDFSAEFWMRNITDTVYYYPFGGLPRAPGMRRTALLTLALRQ